MNQQISDEAERQAALDPTLSFIVQAPAGSGKTGLLTQRFLMLLACAVEVPEECLGITFTRKAAGEMRDRVLGAIIRAENDSNPPLDPYEQKTWALAKKVCAKDKALGWDLLNNPNRLKIQTIDAFCLGITRQMPIMSKLGSSAEVALDASLFYQIAADNLLKSLETEEPWSSAVHQLLDHLDNNLVLARGLLAEMLSHRDQWLPYVGQTLSQNKARYMLEASLKGVVQEALIALEKSAPPGFDELGELAQFAACQVEKLHKKSSILFCRHLSTWPNSDIEHLSEWKGLSELLFTQEFAWRKTVTEQQGFPAPSKAKDKTEKQYYQMMKSKMCEYLTKLEEYTVFRENLQRFCECPPLQYNDSQWKMVETLVQLLPVLTAELSLVFQEKGQVDFVEISLSALKALGESDSPTDLALYLDNKIRHILVDEFQDTSFTQFRLLEKLTAGWQPMDGKTLFLVGDPMQSIYRFRQAEVGLFLRARQKGVGALSLKSLILTTNFRSEPPLVEWTNQTFDKLFPKEDNIATSAITFSASKAARLAEPTSESKIVPVTLETEAEIVIELVKSAKQADPRGSLAVLVRSRTHLQKILPAFRQAQIEYQGIQLELLEDHAIIQDLVSLTRALIHLGDRIAWLAILRAGWCRLSLSDLWIISNHANQLPIWYALSSYMTLTALSIEAKTRLSFVVPILSQALGKRGRLSLRQWVMETWVSLGGPNILENKNSLQNAEAFFTVLDEEQQYNFYEVGVLEKRLGSLFAKPSVLSENAVQVMTVHKAKGLEFDTVIVPGVGRKSLADPKKLLLWEASVGLLQEGYLILAPIQPVAGDQDPIYYYLRKQEERRANHESMRLWYVAATRARKRLYWLTHDNSGFKQPEFSESGVTS